MLEVSDDGRGVDTAALRDRLVATGRWSQARAQLATDADVLDALGTGVSVRGDADELAGRGIGLDLVRQTIARLGGEVKVTSTPGRGTTFSLRLPLSTVARAGDAVQGRRPGLRDSRRARHRDHASSSRTRRPRPCRARAGAGAAARDACSVTSAGSERRPGVVVSFAGKTMVCTVDKIVGPREIIIKPLGPLLAPLTLYAAATISGSGKVQLILDPAQLVRRVYPDAPSTHDRRRRARRWCSPAARSSSTIRARSARR